MTRNDLVPELTNGEFDSFAKDGLVFLDFFAEWCMPCTIVGPIVEELSQKFKGKIKFGKVNVDESSKIAQRFDVSSIPTFILLENSEVVERMSGAMTHEELSELLEKHAQKETIIN